MAPRPSSAPTKDHSGRTGAGTGVIRIGAQGWSYPAWLGPFYPPDTRSSDFLNIYARAFDTVEVDATLYAAPSVSTLRGWASQVPAGFTFALKMPQEVTHDL